MIRLKYAGNTKKEHHYFVSCAFGWTACSTLTAAIAKMRGLIKSEGRKKMHVLIFKVPGSVESTYEINFYCPQVKGTIMISAEDFEV
jgi:hypothetical protein